MELIQEANRIFVPDDAGNLLAEVTFPAIDGHTVSIDHTFVDPSLRGQGVAGKLLLSVAEKLRREGKKAEPTCSYAVKWFAEHPEYADILA